MTRKVVLIAIVVIGIAASLYVAAERVRVESGNKAVEIVVDYGEIAQITAATGKTPVQVLRSLKQCGVTSVAIAEQTLGDLKDSSLLRIQSDGSLLLDKSVAKGAVHSLEAILGAKNIASIPLGSSAPLPTDYLKQLPAGLPEDAIATAREAELRVVARLVNYPGATPRAIDALLADVKQQGIVTVIFQGDQVLGFKGAVEDTADSFKKHGLMFGRVEFSKQKGELELAEHAQENVIPVHSITQNEMPTLSEGAIVERFQKAVRERGIRICYVRMYETASGNLLRSNADYISKIARAIRAAGYTTKSAHPLKEVNAPSFARILAGAAVGAGIALLVFMIIDIPGVAGVLLALVAVLACAGLGAAGEMGRKAVALLSAMSFPTLAALWATRQTPEQPTAGKNILQRAFGRLLGAIGITVAGGLLIVGLLSARSFMLRIDQFMGIKAAHLIPLVVLAVLYAGGIAWKSATWAEQKQRLREAFARIASSPVLMWQAIGLMALLILVALMVARSGNDAGLQVSSVELRFRSILDKIMFVRPRTKEFLIGYPALLVGIAFALRGRRQWAGILVVVGSIGLVSALNTFCHIHTPLALSALRTVNGLVVGSAIGLAVYWLVGRQADRG